MKEGLGKKGMFGTLRVLGLLRAAEWAFQGVSILAYHGVTDHDRHGLPNARRLHVPRDLFREHLRWISDHLPVLRLADVAAAIAAGTDLPRGVVLTFDDGYRNTLSQALPVLREFRCPATLFVPTASIGQRLWMDGLEGAFETTDTTSLVWSGRIFPMTTAGQREAVAAELIGALTTLEPGQRQAELERIHAGLRSNAPPSDDDRDLLSWSEIRELRAAGIEIGSHAHFHEPLTSYSSRDVRVHLEQSRRMLEAELGPGRFPFSYPFGAWSQEAARLVAAQGFYCAVTGDPGGHRQAGSPFGLRRMLMGADDSLTRLRAAISGVRAMWTPIRSWTQ